MPYRLDIPGWMTEPELKYIETLAAKVPENGHMIEIGSFHGRSSWAWSQSIPQSATLHCIDPWDGSPIVPRNLKHMVGTKSDNMKFDMWDFIKNTEGCENIIISKNSSDVVLPRLVPRSYDLIFIDGDHRSPQVRKDMYLSLPLLKSGGILCGHDFTPAYNDIIVEVTELARVLGTSFEKLPDCTIWKFEIR